MGGAWPTNGDRPVSGDRPGRGADPADRAPLDQVAARASFLARLRSRSDSPAPANLAHPLPPAPPGSPPVPVVGSSALDPDDLTGSFDRAATAAGARVHRVATSRAAAPAIAELVARHDIRRAVASKQHDAWPFVELLVAAGVEVVPFDPATAASADLGLSVASAAIATTGTVVQRTDDVGGRTVSLLPRVHLCVVPASRIVPSSAEVLRRLGEAPLPSNVVLVTGPSRSADIESTLVTGVHGPVALVLVISLDI